MSSPAVNLMTACVWCELCGFPGMTAVQSSDSVQGGGEAFFHDPFLTDWLASDLVNFAG